MDGEFQGPRMSVWVEWLTRNEKREAQKTMIEAINQARDDSAGRNCAANRRNAGTARQAISELLKKMEQLRDGRHN